ncbi:MAG: CRTAC1 family protein, partial [Thermoanaerobaculia bacterium]
IKFFDYDNDGLLDLILTDMHSDMSENVGPEREKLKSRMQWSEEQLQGGDDNVFGNAFYHNLGARGGGPGKFEEISDAVGVENYWPWGLSAGDVNADGFEDLFLTSSMNYPFRYGVNSLLLNNLGKKFFDSEFIVGVEPRKGRKVTQDWFDLDCGGADKDHEHCQGQDGPVTVLGSVGSRSSVIFDLDDDGDLDIVTNEFNGPPMVLVSDLSQQTEVNFLKVALVGHKSNRDALGALVRVTAGDLTVTRVNDGKSGYLSQSSLPLYFGLGKHTEIDRIEVEWPAGGKQVVAEKLLARTLMVIEEEVEE